MDQGCVNEGKDRRLFGKVTCWLQRLLSFQTNVAPFTFVLELPFGFRIITPWPGSRKLLFRVALYRYDYYARKMIFFSAALKRIALTDEAL